MGACGFLRRHIPNFTYFSHRLTEKLKKDLKWTWSEEDEKELEKLKGHLATILVIGTPKPRGEIVCITDASDIGGGGTLFQWQKRTPEETASVDQKIQELNSKGLIQPQTHAKWMKMRRQNENVPSGAHAPLLQQEGGSKRPSSADAPKTGAYAPLSNLPQHAEASSEPRTRSSTDSRTRATAFQSVADPSVCSYTNGVQQHLSACLPVSQTTGMNRDGTLQHNHPDDYQLVPLGSWNWKWNPTRQNYSTFEKELMAGVLVLSSQRRIIGGNPIIWFCDQSAVQQFVQNAPPDKMRLKRWWIFLNSLPLTIRHAAGLKNESCDWFSRDPFQEFRTVIWTNLQRKHFVAWTSTLIYSWTFQKSFIGILEIMKANGNSWLTPCKLVKVACMKA